MKLMESSEEDQATEPSKTAAEKYLMIVTKSIDEVASSVQENECRDAAQGGCELVVKYEVCATPNGMKACRKTCGGCEGNITFR
ncbi:unnamed protein product [Anisakis simplex]|uniref:ShKT domain-containing protein n=1 Tax=Anisakis simplex TaxID=6269 RepID=A0A0M3JKZ1_ANISI|nr:unnamed protein product [Anisakis simplex]